MNIWKILPHMHKPGRTWFGGTVLQSICQKCYRDIIRRHDLRWVRLDNNYRYITNSDKRMVARYGTGYGKKEINNEGGITDESISSNLSK